MSCFATQRQRAAHELGQTPADGQAQAGATILTGGRSVRLAEGVEDRGVLVHRDTDSSVFDL